MVSQRTGERAVDYFGSYVAEVIAGLAFFALAGGAVWALRDSLVDATVSQVMLGTLVMCVFSVPLQLEIKYALHGSRPTPPYTVRSQVVGEVIGRTLAGAVGLGLTIRPTLWGAVIGAVAGLLVSLVSLMLMKPWEPDFSDEELAERKELLREELRRQR